MESFKLSLSDYFKFSSGSTALVGIMLPADYPIITSDRYIVEIRSNSGKCHRFKNINEDIFVRTADAPKSDLRSLQTFENIDDFLKAMKDDPIFLYGYKK